jgi:hypothetical protein
LGWFSAFDVPSTASEPLHQPDRVVFVLRTTLTDESYAYILNIWIWFMARGWITCIDGHLDIMKTVKYQGLSIERICIHQLSSSIFPINRAWHPNTSSCKSTLGPSAISVMSLVQQARKKITQEVSVGFFGMHFISVIDWTHLGITWMRRQVQATTPKRVTRRKLRGCEWILLVLGTWISNYCQPVVES